MINMTADLKIWMPATYRILVHGTVHEQYSGLLGGLTIEPIDQSGEAQVTMLYGPLRDQAALLGILNTLVNSMHLALLLVNCEEIGQHVDDDSMHSI